MIINLKITYNGSDHNLNLKMKSYPTILKYNLDHLGQHIFAFDKLDGSNFRTEWNRKLSKKSRFTFGFKKYGTRNRVIINVDNPFIKMVNIFKEKYAEKFDEIFRKHKLFRDSNILTLYGEFYGENSFGGIHEWGEKHNLYFYDIFLYKKDFVSPSNFYSEFNNLNMPKLVYKGEFTEQFISDVEENKFGIKEGIVYKGVENGKIFIGKIKTNEWLSKIKKLYGEAKMLEY